jgi:hypothetical protein
MSKGKTKRTSTGSTTSTQTLNPFTQQQYTDQTSRIRGLLDSSPVQAYSGPMVAGLSDRETRARGMFDDNVGSYNADFDTARDQIQNAGLFQNFGDVSADYMNPYEQQVIDGTMADITRMNEGQNAAMRGRAAASGAYGGSGVAVGQALNNEAAQREMSRQGSQLRYQGFNDAREFYGRDIDARERRGGLLADLATRRHGLGMDDAAGMDAFGQADRGIDQAGMDANYNEFLRQREEDQRRIQNEMGLLGSIPTLVNSSGTSTQTDTQSSNPGLLGTLGQVGSLASMFVPGGGLASMFMRGAGAAASAGSNARPR